MMTTKYAKSHGPIDARVVQVIDAATREDTSRGKVLSGEMGDEQSRWLAHYGRGMTTRGWYVTAIDDGRCRDENGEPLPIATNAAWLDFLHHCYTHQPEVIVATGQHVCMWLTGKKLEVVRGLPQRCVVPGVDAVIMPIYHPSAGYHHEETRNQIATDYSRVAQVVRGQLSPVVDDVDASYVDVDGHTLADVINGWWVHVEVKVISIDTEGTPSSPWAVQVSDAVGSAYVLRRTAPGFEVGIAALQQYVDDYHPTVVMHNAMYDMLMCRVMGLELTDAQLYDTMYAAYLLRTEPQGLKALAYRWCGVDMVSYEDTVGAAGAWRHVEYLHQVVAYPWPVVETTYGKPTKAQERKGLLGKPTHHLSAQRVVHNNDGTVKLYRPQSLPKRAQGIINDIEKGKLQPEEVYERWMDTDSELLAQCTAALGPMVEGSLDDLPLDEAVAYSGRDADVTLRLYHVMISLLADHRLPGKGNNRHPLTRLMMEGMEVLPVLEEMQATGMPCSRKYFVDLYEQMNDEASKLQCEISAKYYWGKPCNPGSSEHVATIMRRRGLQGTKRTSTGAMSTAKGSIEYLKYVDPAIKLIFEWRERQHVRDSFCKVVLNKLRDTGDDNAIQYVRCRLKSTRTATRRLASTDPNLLAIPSRTRLGKAVRDGYRCERGEVLGAWDLCLAPDTRVLKADLTWVPISALVEGDRLVAIDEHRRSVRTDTGRVLGRPRRLLTATVERTATRYAECQRITLSNGVKIVASREHPWLVRDRRKFGKGNWEWVKTEDLLPDHEMCRLTDPWDTDETRMGGWVAGMFDGEGSFDRADATMTFTQRDGEVMRQTRNWLSESGYDFHEPYSNIGGFPGSRPAQQVWMCGMIDCMHFVGTVRPFRFLENIEQLWEGKELRRHRLDKDSPNCGQPVFVERVVSCGVRQVVSIQTSTKTFIAEGFFTHNCQIEMRYMAHASNDQLLRQRVISGADIHSETAATIFNVPIDKVDKQLHRTPAKTAGFGIIYGISGPGLLTQLESLGLLGWDAASCDELIEAWLGVYSGVASYMERIKDETYDKGYVVDHWGMVRHLPGIWHSNKQIAAEAGRAAVSHTIQGGAQGMIQRSMAWLRPIVRDMQLGGMNIKWVLQVHDELILKFDEELWDVVDPLVREALTEHCGVQLSVPVGADGHMADNWGGLK